MKIEVIGTASVSGYYVGKCLPDGTPIEYEFNVVTIAVTPEGDIYSWDEQTNKWVPEGYDALAKDAPDGKMTIEVDEKDV